MTLFQKDRQCYDLRFLEEETEARERDSGYEQETENRRALNHPGAGSSLMKTRVTDTEAESSNEARGIRANARFFIQMALNIVTHINVWAHIHVVLSCPPRGLEEVAPQEFHPLKAPRRVPGLGGDPRRPDSLQSQRVREAPKNRGPHRPKPQCPEHDNKIGK